MSEICLATSGFLVGVAPSSAMELAFDLTMPTTMKGLLLTLAASVKDLDALLAVAVT